MNAETLRKENLPAGEYGVSFRNPRHTIKGSPHVGKRKKYPNGRQGVSCTLKRHEKVGIVFMKKKITGILLFCCFALRLFAVSDAGFEVLGTAAKTAELRNLIAAADDQGNRMVLARVGNAGPHGGALLVWNIDKGTSGEYTVPPEVNPAFRHSYASVLARDGRYYYDQYGYVVCFDPKTRETKFLGRATGDEVMTYCEAPDGTIYLGTTPTCKLISYSPHTGKFTDHGRMDEREAYLSYIAVDRENFVYCGIGHAKANIVCLNPKTGEKIQLLPEDQRKTGKAKVMPAADGTVYASFGDFSVQMVGGKIMKNHVKMPSARADRAANYGDRLKDFPDGSAVVRWDLYRNLCDVREKDGTTKTYSFDYTPGGVNITSIAPSPDGKKIHITTAHPMHWVIYDPETGIMTDHGIQPAMTGGNFCNYANDGKRMYACEYPFGELWIYEPNEVPRWKAENIPHFGPWPGVLARMVKAPEGHVVPMMMPPMLFGKGKREGAVFQIPLIVEKPGHFFLNLQFLCSKRHGKVTVRFLGQQADCELQSTEDKPSEILTLGPFNLDRGEYIPEIMVHSMSGDMPPMFGLTGIELAPSKRSHGETKKHLDNPRVAGRWGNSIARPRTVTVHPDGRHVLFSGFAGYGLTGGAIGIYDLETGEKSQIEDYLPGLSCIALRTLPNGDLVGGTSVAAPGGGYREANEAAVFIIDWGSRKVKKTRSISDASDIISLEVWNRRIYAMLSDGRLLVLEPETLEIEKIFDLKENGSVPRCSLLISEDDRMFILQSNGISEFDRRTDQPRLLGRPLQKITAGGAAVKGYLYFTGNAINVQRFRIPPVAAGN